MQASSLSTLLYFFSGSRRHPAFLSCFGFAFSQAWSSLFVSQADLSPAALAEAQLGQIAKAILDWPAMAFASRCQRAL